MPRARAPYHMWYPSSVGQGNGEAFNRNIVSLSVLLFLLVCSVCAMVWYVIILWMMLNQNSFLTFLYLFNVAIAILVFSIKINSQRLPKAITQIRFDVIHMKQRRHCRNCFFYYDPCDLWTHTSPCITSRISSLLAEWRAQLWLYIPIWTKTAPFSVPWRNCCVINARMFKHMEQNQDLQLFLLIVQ